jgi:hypothetical protein
LPLLRPRSEADAKFRQETTQEILNTLPPDLAAALKGLQRAIDDTDKNS